MHILEDKYDELGTGKLRIIVDQIKLCESHIHFNKLLKVLSFDRVRTNVKSVKEYLDNKFVSYCECKFYFGLKNETIVLKMKDTRLSSLLFKE